LVQPTLHFQWIAKMKYLLLREVDSVIAAGLFFVQVLD